MKIRSIRTYSEASPKFLHLCPLTVSRNESPKNNWVKITFDKYPDEVKKIAFSRPAMTISLSRAPLKAMVISRPGYVTIGFVRWGLEFGWLTIAPNGNYVRVNGSFEEILNYQDVKSAMYRANKTRRLSCQGIM